MFERHAAYLDLASVLVRLKHHKAISRGEIVRAFVEFIVRSGIDFTQFETVGDMIAYLVDYFERIPNGGRLPLLLESNLLQPEREDVEQQDVSRDDDLGVTS